MDTLLDCTLGIWLNLKTYKKESELLEINKFEVKSEFDDIIKVLYHNWGIIVSINYWKLFFV